MAKSSFPALNSGGRMVNDRRVYEIIKEKLRMSKGSSIREHLGDAFDLITDERERNFKGDIDYAAAEHYLFARWLIAWTDGVGYPFLAIGAGGYSGIKKLLSEDLLPRFGKGPVTPYADGDIQWMRRGANDGLSDFKASYWSSRKVPQDPDDPF